MRRFPFYRILCALLWAASVRAETMVTTYVLDAETGSNHRQISMNVEHCGDLTRVIYNNEFGDQEVTNFRDPFTSLSARYLNPARREISRVFYDHAQKKISVSGLINADYRLLPQTFDNNGSLLYLFSVMHPDPGEKLVFHLVQSNLSHIEDPFLRLLIAQLVGPVEMYLKNVSREMLETDGCLEAVFKYELGIHDGRLAPFWPHKYYFWYRCSDHRFVKYQGQDAYRNMNTIRFLDTYRHARPEDLMVPVP